MRQIPIIRELSAQLDNVKQQICDSINSINFKEKLEEFGEICLTSLAHVPAAYTVVPPYANHAASDAAKTSSDQEPEPPMLPVIYIGMLPSLLQFIQRDCCYNSRYQ